MVTFDEVAAMLDEIADGLPEVFFKDLNGGVYLLPESKMHKESRKNQPLYILGEFTCQGIAGKCIYLYYGSFMEVYPHLAGSELKKELKDVLIHEFTHHLELLAGQNDLVIKDENKMKRYCRH